MRKIINVLILLLSSSILSISYGEGHQRWLKERQAKRDREEASNQRWLKSEQAKRDKEEASNQRWLKSEQAKRDNEKSKRFANNQRWLKSEQAKRDKEEAGNLRWLKSEQAKRDKEEAGNLRWLKSEQAKRDKEEAGNLRWLKSEQAKRDKEEAANLRWLKSRKSNTRAKDLRLVEAARKLRSEKKAKDLRLVQAARKLRSEKKAKDLRLVQAARKLRSEKKAKDLRLVQAARKRRSEKKEKDLRLVKSSQLTLEKEQTKKQANDLRLVKLAQKARSDKKAKDIRLVEAAQKRRNDERLSDLRRAGISAESVAVVTEPVKTLLTELNGIKVGETVVFTATINGTLHAGSQIVSEIIEGSFKLSDGKWYKENQVHALVNSRDGIAVGQKVLWTTKDLSKSIKTIKWIATNGIIFFNNGGLTMSSTVKPLLDELNGIKVGQKIIEKNGTTSKQLVKAIANGEFLLTDNIWYASKFIFPFNKLKIKDVFGRVATMNNTMEDLFSSSEIASESDFADVEIISHLPAESIDSTDADGIIETLIL